MIYPKGKVLHQNLSTEYTDVAQLLSTLKLNEFNGTVEIELGDRKGAFFIIAGKCVNAAVGGEENPVAVAGEDAIEELLILSTQPKAVLNVYEATVAEIEFAVSTLKSEILFSKLSTDFVRMDRFIQKLATEKHTGYIEVFTKANKTVGLLSLKDGEVMGLLITPESGPPSFFDQAAVPALLEEVMRQGAVFDVYRSLSEPIKKEADALVAEEPKNQPAEKAVIELELPDPGAGTVKLLEKQKPEAPESDGEISGGRGDLMLGLQSIFSKIEKFVDTSSQKGGFVRAFKRACIERSESYPFLDPFEGQFDYVGGKLRLDVEVPVEEFAVGVADCLNLTLSLVQKELPKNVTLPPGLKGEIEASFKQYQDVIKKSGLQFVVPASYR